MVVYRRNEIATAFVLLDISLYTTVFFHVSYCLQLCSPSRCDNLERSFEGSRLLHFDSKSAAKGKLVTHHHICYQRTAYKGLDVPEYNTNTFINIRSEEIFSLRSHTYNQKLSCRRSSIGS